MSILYLNFIFHIACNTFIRFFFLKLTDFIDEEYSLNGVYFIYRHALSGNLNKENMTSSRIEPSSLPFYMEKHLLIRRDLSRYGLRDNLNE